MCNRYHNNSTSKLSVNATTLLKFFSLIAPAPLPIKLLKQISCSISTNQFNDAIEELTSHHILINNLNLLTLNDNALEFAHSDLDNKQFIKENLDAIFNECENIIEEQSFYPLNEIEYILSHLEYILSQSHVNIDQKVRLLSIIAAFYENNSDIDIAVTYRQQALDCAVKCYSDLNPIVNLCKSNFALVLYDQGKSEDAIALLQNLLNELKSNFSFAHPSIIAIQVHLASIFKDQCRYEDAERLLHEALDAANSKYHAGHPEIIDIQIQLAQLLQIEGKYESAFTILNDCLKAAQKRYSSDDPEISRIQSNIGTLLHDMDFLEEAKSALYQSLLSAQQNFDCNHPTIALRQSNLALVLYDLGEYTSAINLIKTSYQTFFELYGPNHPKTKTVITTMRTFHLASGQQTLFGNA